VTVACSSSSPAFTGAASVSGGSVVAIKSAALIQTGTFPETGPSVASTYVQFFTNAPGTSCSALDASTVAPAGSFQVSIDPSKLPGQTLMFGGSSDPVLTFTSTDSGDAGDAGVAPSLVAASGTIKFGGSGTNLTGTINAQMIVATSPGSTPVTVTGTFTAPLCAD
jgi:hypothetical protein